ncbi:MAG: DsbA family protein [Acidobacteria bacterium]|nr:DsbA family protein [Acidobacteriota bacterium]
MWRVLVTAIVLALSVPAQQKMQTPAAKMRVPPNAPILGVTDAPVTMVEFTDFQCPFCRQFHQQIFPELKKKYIDTGKMRFTQNDLPLDFHGNAVQAAEAVRCAGDQDRYWEMRDTVAANPDRLDRAALAEFARKLSLSSKLFAACLDSRKYEAAVRKEAERALLSKIHGTPSFILGRTTPEGVEGVLIPGAFSAEEFGKLIEMFLPAK